MIVMKFGGSSLATADRIRDCASLIRAALPHHPLVVVSACGPTTRELRGAVERAATHRPAATAVVTRHRQLLVSLGLPRWVADEILAELAELLDGIHASSALSLALVDRVLSCGERLSARIMAAQLRAMGVPALPVEAGDVGLLTDSRHGAARPLGGIATDLGRQLTRLTGVPMVTGFIGRDRRGRITTLGRNGSDLSAALVAAAVGARELQIWTDVDGVMTADPARDTRAVPLPSLSFDTASALAARGATNLHRETLEALRGSGVTVRVLNSRRPAAPGTRIDPCLPADRGVANADHGSPWSSATAAGLRR